MVGVYSIAQSVVYALTIRGSIDPFNLNNAFSDAPNSVIFKGLLQHYPVFQPLGNVCLAFKLCDKEQIAEYHNVGILEKHDVEFSSATQADIPLITMNVVPVSVITIATTTLAPTPAASPSHPSSPIHGTWSTDPAFSMANSAGHITSEFQMMPSSIPQPLSTPRPKIPVGNVTVNSTFFDVSTITSFEPVARISPLTAIAPNDVLGYCLAIVGFFALVGLGTSLFALFRHVPQTLSAHTSSKYRYISKRRKFRHLQKQKSRRRQAVEADITRYLQDLLRSHGTPVTYPSLHAVLWKKNTLEALFNTKALKAQHEEDIGRLEYWQSLATHWRESHLSKETALLYSDEQLKTFQTKAEELQIAVLSKETALLYSDEQLKTFQNKAEELQIAVLSKETALLYSDEQLKTLQTQAEELQIAAKSHERELKVATDAVDILWEEKQADEKKHDDFKREAKAEKARLEAHVKRLESSLARLASRQKKESLDHQTEPAVAQGNVPTLFSTTTETTVEPADGEEDQVKKKNRKRRNPTYRSTQFPYTVLSDERQAPKVFAEAPKDQTPSFLSSVLSEVSTSTPWLSKSSDK